MVCEMVKASTYLQQVKNTWDSCLYYKLIEGQLMVSLLQVNDCLVMGPSVMVIEENTKFPIIILYY